MVGWPSSSAARTAKGVVNMTELVSILEKHPFLEHVDDVHIQQIAEHASLNHFSAGNLIFRQGEPANQFYIIQYGNVALEVFSPQQGPIRLMTLSAGDVLGWSWLFEPYVWHLDARALEPTEAIALNGAGLRDECDTNHKLGYSLMRRSVRIIEQRLQAAMIQMLDIYGLQQDVR
jgi:CRP-like cAMP-binding protein